RLVLSTVLLFVFTTTGFAPATDAKPPQKRSMAEMWQDTGLRADRIISVMTNETCYRAIEFYLGCFYALRELAGWAGKQLVVSEGKFAVVNKTPSQKVEDESYYQHFQRKKNERFEEQQLLLGHFNNQKNGRLSFPKNV